MKKGIRLLFLLFFAFSALSPGLFAEDPPEDTLTKGKIRKKGNIAVFNRKLIDALNSGDLKASKRWAKRADPNALTPDTKTPVIILAMQKGMREAAEIIASKKKFDPNVRSSDANQYTPLYLSINYNYPEVFMAVVDAGANLEDKCFGYTPLNFAAKMRNVTMVQYLQKKGADINAKNSQNYSNTALVYAIFNNDAKMVRTLLNLGADKNTVDTYGWTPLMFASWYGYLEIMDLLLKGGSGSVVSLETRTFKDGDTALLLALKNGRTAAAQKLRWAGANITVVNNLNESALFHAARTNDHFFILELIGAGMDVKQKNKCGRTPLTSAAWSGHYGTMWLLRQHGAK